MRRLGDEEPLAYRVEFSEAAEAEIDSVVFWMLGHMPDDVEEWYAGLKRAALSLETLPRRYAYVPNYERYEGEVRRLLYGKGRLSYHLIYRIVEAQEGNDVRAVYILHLFHSAQNTIIDND